MPDLRQQQQLLAPAIVCTARRAPSRRPICDYKVLIPTHKPKGVPEMSAKRHKKAASLVDVVAMTFRD